MRMRWTIVKEMNEKNYSLKKSNEVDYSLKEMKWSGSSKTDGYGGHRAIYMW